MDNVQEKRELLKDYLTEYNDNDRLGFINIARKKYRFENYRMSDNNINPNDMIVSQPNICEMMDAILTKNFCSIEDFKNVFNELTLEQIYTIGF